MVYVPYDGTERMEYPIVTWCFTVCVEQGITKNCISPETFRQAGDISDTNLPYPNMRLSDIDHSGAPAGSSSS